MNTPNTLDARRTFKIKLPIAIFISAGSLFWACALVWILYSVIREGSYMSLADQAKIALFVLSFFIMVYSFIYAFLFEIIVSEEGIQMRKPPFSWRNQDEYRLRWNDIERLKLEPFLFVESKRYVLKAKKNSGKKSLRFPSAVENFSELAEIILRKVEATPMAKGAIEYDLTPHKLSFRRFLFLLVIAVGILLFVCWILGIIHFPSLLKI